MKFQSTDKIYNLVTRAERSIPGDKESKNMIVEQDGKCIDDWSQLIVEFAIDKHFTISKLPCFYLYNCFLYLFIYFYIGHIVLSPSDKLEKMVIQTHPPSSYAKHVCKYNENMDFSRTPILNHRENRHDNDVTLYYRDFEDFTEVSTS